MFEQFVIKLERQQSGHFQRNQHTNKEHDMKLILLSNQGSVSNKLQV